MILVLQHYPHSFEFTVSHTHIILSLTCFSLEYHGTCSNTCTNTVCCIFHGPAVEGGFVSWLSFRGMNSMVIQTTESPLWNECLCYTVWLFHHSFCVSPIKIVSLHSHCIDLKDYAALLVLAEAVKICFKMTTTVKDRRLFNNFLSHPFIVSSPLNTSTYLNFQGQM